jgi:cytidylate kinase
MVAADDAVTIDTSDMTIEQAIAAASDVIKSRLG